MAPSLNPMRHEARESLYGVRVAGPCIRAAHERFVVHHRGGQAGVHEGTVLREIRLLKRDNSAGAEALCESFHGFCGIGHVHEHEPACHGVEVVSEVQRTEW